MSFFPNISALKKRRNGRNVVLTKECRRVSYHDSHCASDTNRLRRRGRRRGRRRRWQQQLRVPFRGHQLPPLALLHKEVNWRSHARRKGKERKREARCRGGNQQNTILKSNLSVGVPQGGRTCRPCEFSGLRHTFQLPGIDLAWRNVIRGLLSGLPGATRRGFPMGQHSIS